MCDLETMMQINAVRRHWINALALICVASCANHLPHAGNNGRLLDAEDGANMVGQWFYRDSLANVTVLRKDGKYIVDFSVGNEDCSGVLYGEARRHGRQLTMIVQEESFGRCVITMDFLESTVQIKAEGCGDYHGAACGFEGEATKKK